MRQLEALGLKVVMEEREHAVLDVVSAVAAEDYCGSVLQIRLHHESIVK